MTDPRLLRIITRLNVGGPARQAVYLNRTLQRNGFQSALVSGREGAEEGRVSPGDGNHVQIPTLQRAVAPLSDWRAYRAIRGLIRRTRPHIVHTHLAKAGTLGRIAAHRAGVPILVHTFHGHVLEGYFNPVVTGALLRVERHIARYTDALLAVSATVRDELLDMGIGQPSQWHVLPVGFELDELLAPLPDPVEARRSLDLPTGGPVIGIVGRLVPVKDHNTFLEIARQIANSHPDVTFAVAGDGELRRELETRARSLDGRVRFLGWVSDLPTLYSALDIVVLTSKNEGTPASLIEAAAAGKPAVGTRVGGVADVIVDGVTGFLAAPGDIDRFVERVRALLAEPSLRQTLGAAARDHVRDGFSAERLVRDLTSLYSELLRRHGVSEDQAPGNREGAR